MGQRPEATRKIRRKKRSWGWCDWNWSIVEAQWTDTVITEQQRNSEISQIYSETNNYKYIKTCVMHSNTTSGSPQTTSMSNSKLPPHSHSLFSVSKNRCYYKKDRLIYLFFSPRYPVRRSRYTTTPTFTANKNRQSTQNMYQMYLLTKWLHSPKL